MVVRVEDSWDLSSRIFHYAIRQPLQPLHAASSLSLSLSFSRSLARLILPPLYLSNSLVQFRLPNRIRKSANLIKARQVRRFRFFRKKPSPNCGVLFEMQFRGLDRGFREEISLAIFSSFFSFSFLALLGFGKVRTDEIKCSVSLNSPIS